MNQKKGKNISLAKKEIEKIKKQAKRHLEELKKESKMMCSFTEDMKDLYRMLTVKMKQFGITSMELEELIKEPLVKNELHEHPLVLVSSDYAKQATSFLDSFFYEHQKMVQQFNIDISLEDVKEEIDAISSHHSLIVSKSWNFLHEYYKKPSSKTAKKFYFLVKQAIEDSHEAVKSLGQKRGSCADKTNELLKKLSEAEKEIKKFNI